MYSETKFSLYNLKQICYQEIWHAKLTICYESLEESNTEQVKEG